MRRRLQQMKYHIRGQGIIEYDTVVYQSSVFHIFHSNEKDFVNGTAVPGMGWCTQ